MARPYNEEKIYHVYEWYDVDTGYIFYVGMGLKNRWKIAGRGKRNKRFLEYKATHRCKSRKIVDNVSEKEGCLIEDKRIKELKAIGMCSCNITSATSHGGYSVGKDNSMYGVSPRERMDEETYKLWREHRSETLKRGGNGRATKIIAAKDEKDYEFDCVLDCAEFIRNEIGGFDCALDSTRTRISECLRCGMNYKGYSFKVQYPDEYKSSTANVKTNVGLDGQIFNCATRYCKEKNMFLSVLISKLIEDCQEISTGIKGENLKQKTFRFSKDLMTKLDNLVVKIHGHRGDVINKLLFDFLNKEGAYES